MVMFLVLNVIFCSALYAMELPEALPDLNGKRITVLRPWNKHDKLLAVLDDKHSVVSRCNDQATNKPATGILGPDGFKQLSLTLSENNNAKERTMWEEIVSYNMWFNALISANKIILQSPWLALYFYDLKKDKPIDKLNRQQLKSYGSIAKLNAAQNRLFFFTEDPQEFRVVNLTTETVQSIQKSDKSILKFDISSDGLQVAFLKERALEIYKIQSKCQANNNAEIVLEPVNIIKFDRSIPPDGFFSFNKYSVFGPKVGLHIEYYDVQEQSVKHCMVQDSSSSFRLIEADISSDGKQIMFETIPSQHFINDSQNYVALATHCTACHNFKITHKWPRVDWVTFDGQKKNAYFVQKMVKGLALCKLALKQ